MADLQTRWTIDTCVSISTIFEKKFDLPLVLGKSRNTCEDTLELDECMNNCIRSNNYNDYIYLIFKDYEDYFGTKVFIPGPLTSIKKICQIMNESYRLDVNLIELYYKGVTLETLDSISFDVVGNNVNLADKSQGVINATQSEFKDEPEMSWDEIE